VAVLRLQESNCTTGALFAARSLPVVFSAFMDFRGINGLFPPEWRLTSGRAIKVRSWAHWSNSLNKWSISPRCDRPKCPRIWSIILKTPRRTQKKRSSSYWPPIG
jgi:hypothetical protein